MKPEKPALVPSGWIAAPQFPQQPVGRFNGRDLRLPAVGAGRRRGTGRWMGWAALTRRVAWKAARRQLLAGGAGLKGQL